MSKIMFCPTTVIILPRMLPSIVAAKLNPSRPKPSSISSFTFFSGMVLSSARCVSRGPTSPKTAAAMLSTSESTILP